MSEFDRDVRAVNEAFYQAFRERDYEAMETIWAQHAPVVCMHPGMGPVIGRAAVLSSWRGILNHPGAPTLSCSSVEVHVLGTSAIVTCLEGATGRRARLVATNVFTQEDGRWRLVHHQAGPLSPTASAETAPEPDLSVWN